MAAPASPRPGHGARRPLKGPTEAPWRPLGSPSSSPAPFPARAAVSGLYRGPSWTGALTSAAPAGGARPRSAVGVIYAWFEFNRPCRERILADPGTGQYVGAMQKAFVSCNIEHSPATTALRMVSYSLLYTGAMLMVVSKRNRDKFRRYTQILAGWAVVQLVVLVLAARAWQSCTHPGNCVMIPGFINSNWWMFIVAPVGLPVAMWFVYVEEGRSLASVGYMMAFLLTQFAAFQGEKSLTPLVVKRSRPVGEQMLVRLVLHPFLWRRRSSSAASASGSSATSTTTSAPPTSASCKAAGAQQAASATLWPRPSQDAETGSGRSKWRTAFTHAPNGLGKRPARARGRGRARGRAKKIWSRWISSNSPPGLLNYVELASVMDAWLCFSFTYAIKRGRQQRPRKAKAKMFANE